MAMMSLQFMGKIPFKHVLIHGLIRDEKGQKMSKSKGNVINPLDILDQYGADSLRLALLISASPSQDVRLSPDIIVSMRNFCTKLWNTARYANMNHITLNKAQPSPKHPMNKWIVHKIAHMQEQLTQMMEQYHMHEAASLLYKSFWHEFCDWYLESSKFLLSSDQWQQETQSVFGFALHRFLHFLHPFIPHITESVWNFFEPQAKPLALQHFPESFSTQPENSIKWFKNIVSKTRSFQKKMPSAAFAIYGTEETEHLFQTFDGVFESMLPYKLVWSNWKSKALTLCVAIDQGSFLFIHSSEMNVAQEIEDLKASIKKSTQQLTTLTQRLQAQTQAPESARSAWERSCENFKQQILLDNEAIAQFEKVITN